MSYSIRELSTKVHLDFNNAKGEFSDIIFFLGEKYGRELGFRVKRTSTKESEYLVDLCWIYQDSTERWMGLALESEISNDSIKGIREDFKKLLDIKARTKVGLFVPSESRKKAH